MQLPLALVAILSAAALVHAHIAAFTKGMWCINGSTGDNLNSDDPVLPLYQLEFDQWWMHAFNGCNQRPPNPGDFLTLPSGDSVVLELASNQAFTSLSYGGRLTSDWPNGQDYPDNNTNPSCITAPNLHTQNQSMAAGTALAISYQSDITKVTPENLAVISVAYQCGQPNMYFSASRCQVSGNTDSSKSLGSPKPAAWCEGNSTACVKGPKQMLYWHQASGNNIEVSGYDLSGEPKSPAYNAKCGFADGGRGK
ncbi:hypothetical protein GGU11DRAFT_727711 [Lentinula aff. detonsa]|nr:hypothetical protein GGU11DRAFT_727711 [Lentinula aff. detonsa]